ncbi:MAG TPA: PRC-barrel domain containing protein [Chloroflexi bacterium]|jgi:sporulation protein YlmC with PRC-barrel domain|nr:PRC-barrel domain containing protein [Chloroflexota bacterium]
MPKTTMEPEILSATTMIGDSVINPEGENLGKIEELMLDLEEGCVMYAVLSFGGVLGIGDKLFAVPWEALTLDPEQKKFILDIDKERLKDAPSFDKDNWPTTVDRRWMTEIYEYYGFEPYWEEEEAPTRY